MPTSILVPHLQAKLDLLLRYDTNLTNRTALAQELGVSPPQISKWQTGGDYPARRNLIPGHHFERLKQLFNIGPNWLRADRVDDEPQSEYVSRLEAELRIRAPRSSWQALFLETPLSDQLHLRRLPSLPGEGSSLRGLVREDLDDGFEGDRFFKGERVYIELAPSTQWSHPKIGLFGYLLLALMDGAKIQSVWPSEQLGIQNRKMESLVITIPDQTIESGFRITAPIGHQSLFAVLTREPLAAELYDEFMRADHPDPGDCLTRVVAELRQRNSGTWTCLRYRYLVEENPSVPFHS